MMILVLPSKRRLSLWLGFTVLAAMLSACSMPEPAFHPFALAAFDAPPFKDRRAHFTDFFCREMARSGRDDCLEYLRGFPAKTDLNALAPNSIDESGGVVGSETQPDTRMVRPVVVVWLPGVFGECFQNLVKPFDDVVPMVKSRLSVESDFLQLPGRMGSESNAAIVADRVRSHARRGHDVILVGYSKGGTDGLMALALHLDLEQQVKAVLTVSTPVLGSPAADEIGPLYERTLGHLPISSCPASDGQEVRSLSEAYLRDFWMRHRVPAKIPVYAIAGLPRRERVSSLLRPSYDEMLGAGLLNDSQVPVIGAFAPGAQVLGFADADHWAVAMPSRKLLPEPLRGLLIDDFPRAELLTAALTLILEDIYQ